MMVCTLFRNEHISYHLALMEGLPQIHIKINADSYQHEDPDQSVPNHLFSHQVSVLISVVSFDKCTLHNFFYLVCLLLNPFGLPLQSLLIAVLGDIL